MWNIILMYYIHLIAVVQWKSVRHKTENHRSPETFKMGVDVSSPKNPYLKTMQFCPYFVSNVNSIFITFYYFRVLSRLGFTIVFHFSIQFVVYISLVPYYLALYDTTFSLGNYFQIGAQPKKSITLVLRFYIMFLIFIPTRSLPLLMDRPSPQWYT